MMHAETESIPLFDPMTYSNQSSLSVNVALPVNLPQLSTLIGDIICQKTDVSFIGSNERFCEVVSQLSKFQLSVSKFRSAKLWNTYLQMIFC